MAKYALLVGVGEFKHQDLDPLPKALLDVAAMRRALVDPELGAFEEDKIIVCENPGRFELEDCLYELFNNTKRDDLLLFYFSGHGISDESGQFYFSTSETRKDDGRLRPTTAVNANIVHGYMDAKNCKSKRMALILDCCHSGVFAKGAKIKGGAKARIKEELGGEGRAILTAASATEYAWSKDEYPLSAYTHFLLEAIMLNVKTNHWIKTVKPEIEQSLVHHAKVDLF